MFVRLLYCLFNIIFSCFSLSFLSGHHKCREQWTIDYERSFNIFLDLILLIFPLIMLSSAYFSITKTLWQNMTLEKGGKRYAKSGHGDYKHACKQKQNNNNKLNIHQEIQLQFIVLTSITPCLAASPLAFFTLFQLVLAFSIVNKETNSNVCMFVNNFQMGFSILRAQSIRKVSINLINLM